MEEFKKVTQKQARRIRQVISDYVGSTARIWPKRNYTYIVWLPLQSPSVLSYKGEVTLEDFKYSEEPLVFQAGHYKHQRIIPSLEYFEKLKYKITNSRTSPELRTEWI